MRDGRRRYRIATVLILSLLDRWTELYSQVSTLIRLQTRRAKEKKDSLLSTSPIQYYQQLVKDNGIETIVDRFLGIFNRFYLPEIEFTFYEKARQIHTYEGRIPSTFFLLGYIRNFVTNNAAET